MKIVNHSAVQHGEVSVRILEKYREELIHHAIITVERTRVRIRIEES
jgi:hypothetical protein